MKKQKNKKQHTVFKVSSIIYFIVMVLVSMLGSSAFLSKITGNIPAVDTLIFKLQQIVIEHCDIVFLIVLVFTVAYGIILVITHGSIRFLSDDIGTANNRITEETDKANSKIKEAKISINNESDRINEYIKVSKSNAKEFSAGVEEAINEARMTTAEVKVTTALVKELALLNHNPQQKNNHADKTR